MGPALAGEEGEKQWRFAQGRQARGGTDRSAMTHRPALRACGQPLGGAAAGQMRSPGALEWAGGRAAGHASRAGWYVVGLANGGVRLCSCSKRRWDCWQKGALVRPCTGDVARGPLVAPHRPPARLCVARLWLGACSGRLWERGPASRKSQSCTRGSIGLPLQSRLPTAPCMHRLLCPCSDRWAGGASRPMCLWEGIITLYNAAKKHLPDSSISSVG